MNRTRTPSAQDVQSANFVGFTVLAICIFAAALSWFANHVFGRGIMMFVGGGVYAFLPAHVPLSGRTLTENSAVVWGAATIAVACGVMTLIYLFATAEKRRIRADVRAQKRGKKYADDVAREAERQASSPQKMESPNEIERLRDERNDFFPGQATMSKELPAEVRFLAGASDDPQEQQRIVRAYFALAHGTAESAAVQFALLATALSRRQAEAAESAQNLAKACAALLPAVNANHETALKLLSSRDGRDAEQTQAAVRTSVVATLRPLAEALEGWARRVEANNDRRFIVIFALCASTLSVVLLNLILK